MPPSSSSTSSYNRIHRFSCSHMCSCANCLHVMYSRRVRLQQITNWSREKNHRQQHNIRMSLRALSLPVSSFGYTRLGCVTQKKFSFLPSRNINWNSRNSAPRKFRCIERLKCAINPLNPIVRLKKSVLVRIFLNYKNSSAIFFVKGSIYTWSQSVPKSPKSESDPNLWRHISLLTQIISNHLGTSAHRFVVLK